MNWPWQPALLKNGPAVASFLLNVWQISGIVVTTDPAGVGQRLFGCSFSVVHFTVWVRTGEVLVRKPELPPYTAVIGCMPLDKFEIVKLAWPALREPLPRVLLPSLKVTVPVGAAVPGALAATVAVKVTA